MENQKKILTRVQLINWHFFENERIAFHGSTLISGENTAGKSTILDAIQLVLTTNTRKFNVAANEKGNRSLKGYVRCKIGNVGEAYLRKNVVPANVALEFYEEKGDRYFVIGVHMLSTDEESPVVTRWYVEECRLEALSFMSGDRPALADEFKVNGKKIRYIDQKNAARDRFKRRLGNLDDKFFDIIPKSLAFKPMDNVKEFINKFVLPEERVDVVSLRENIETLSELESVLECSRKQLDALEQILAKQEAIEVKDYAIRVNEILLQIAKRDALKQELEEREKQIRLKTQAVENNREQIIFLEKQIKDADAQILAINVSIDANASSRLEEEAKRRMDTLQDAITVKETDERKLKEQLQLLKQYLRDLAKLNYKPADMQDVEMLGQAGSREERQEGGNGQRGIPVKNAITERLEDFERNELEKIRSEKARLNEVLRQIGEAIDVCNTRLKNLEKRILTYPDYAKSLKEAVEKEFSKRGICSDIYFLSELLEITDSKWTNAVEGYFHTQKFYLIVEPEYYDVALEVYNRNRKHIHTAGIINTKKLPLDNEVNHQSLAYVVKSENRYAKAYANYVLGRVMRCEDVRELENYSISITPECMLYQGYVVRHINPRDYENPFIGQNAYRVQIENVRREIEEKSVKRSELRDKMRMYADVLENAGKVKLELIKLYMYAPDQLKDLREQLSEAKIEYEEATKDPTLIELRMKLEEKLKDKGKILQEKDRLDKENARLEVQVENAGNEIAVMKQEHQDLSDKLDWQSDTEGIAYKEAEEKYFQNRKTKAAKTIAENFAPQRVQFLNERDELLNGNQGLKALQYQFNHDFTLDFMIGLEGMSEYREATRKLKSVEIVRHEEKLKSAKEDCEQIFRSDFLSKMKEHIEAARNEFKNLNKALDSIYYGEDSYHFKISFDRKKEGLYKMITSENNQEGMNLWTSAFEAEYKEEMSELFDKLMTRDDNGQKIVEEYTDYRSYLDYDIEIHKRDGSVQRFSDIYGEKSGSETQVPYYVAIAASFYQLYRYGNSVRIMLLDEAFDKMDDERIQSMMDFFNGLGLQVILATPPAKIEVIGEKVGTILTAIRVGQNSIVEEYDL